MAKTKKLFRSAMKIIDNLLSDLAIPYDHHKNIALDTENKQTLTEAKQLLYKAWQKLGDIE